MLQLVDSVENPEHANPPQDGPDFALERVLEPPPHDIEQDAHGVQFSHLQSMIGNIWQLVDSDASPMQSFPPCNGPDLDLVRVFLPLPQIFEHDVQVPQISHVQSVRVSGSIIKLGQIFRRKEGMFFGEMDLNLGSPFWPY